MGLIARLREVRRKRLIYHYLRERLGTPILWTAMVFMLPLKYLTILHPLLPTKVREMLRDWDSEMFLIYIRSFGRRAYMDKRCVLNDPPNWQPKTEVDPQWRFTEEDIKRFYEQGFMGPFKLCSREEMYQLREQIQKEIEQPSKIYGMTTGRDRHLDCPTLWQLLRRPEWTERIAQLLGPNLLLWRSQVFLKPPGAPEITWHQASVYLSEEAYKCTLFPREINELFQLTTWVAFDDVDYDNGCMQFIPGTQRKIHTMKIGGDDTESFAKAKVKLDIEINPDKVVTMEMEAGEFIIFTERCVHGSPPNITKDRRRWGMAFRTIVPDCHVYGDDVTKHRVFYLEQDFDLSKWGCVVLRGEDTAGINRIREPLMETIDNPVTEPGELVAAGQGMNALAGNQH
jgi:non-haem Fe2+, alpha-ketoglutarate-dependent halogenase